MIRLEIDISLYPPTCSELSTDMGISQDDGINSIHVQSDMRIGSSIKLCEIMIRDAPDHMVTRIN